jgi:NAD(P)-dependent dehydrogenase (short-subunit alcohol dehydrogenase family)
MRLQDKVIIVTGSAQGIGKAYALRLAEEGAKVVITDILDPKPTASEIQARGGDALPLVVDVASEAGTEEMARKTIEAFGRIDVLINNAAVFGQLELKPFDQIPVAEWDKVMAVNVKGLFLCARAVFPQMRQQKKGKIISIASGTIFKGTPLFLHYVTSKGAVVAFTRALAREMGQYGITVNALAPGLTLSDAVKNHPQQTETRRAILQTRCLPREEVPEDLTGTMVYLCSNDSDFVSGQTIVVDGGSALH